MVFIVGDDGILGLEVLFEGVVVFDILCEEVWKDFGESEESCFIDISDGAGSQETWSDLFLEVGFEFFLVELGDGLIF